MRRTLIVFMLVAIAMAMALPAFAGDLNWSAGVTLTQSEAGVQIGSRIEASRNGRLIGAWFSSSGQLPIMVQGLDYDAFGDFPGIRKIQRVVLSPDHGQTVWEGENVQGKGYRVIIPKLKRGSLGLEWGVTSKDKHNRLLLIVIPINWNSHRSSSSTNQAMMQQEPPGSENFTDQQWFGWLTGFVPASATWDPAFVAKQQMLSQQSAFVVTPAPVVIPTLAPPAPAPFEERPIIQPKEGETTRQEMPARFIRIERVSAIDFTAHVDKGDRLTFKRHGKFVAEGVVIIWDDNDKSVEIGITKGGSVLNGDEIFLGGKR